MTSNERKILECIWNHGGEVDIRLISDKTGLSSDYSGFLCRALQSAGHLELSGHAFCRLSEKGHKYFQDRDNIGVIALSSLPQEESSDEPALSGILSDDENEESKGDEDIDETKKDQEVEQGPAAEQTDYGASEKQEDEIDKKLEELFPNQDKNEGKTDSDPSAGDRGITRETEENVFGNDSRYEAGVTEKQTINPIEHIIEVMIERFVGLLKGR